MFLWRYDLAACRFYVFPLQCCAGRSRPRDRVGTSNGDKDAQRCRFQQRRRIVSQGQCQWYLCVSKKQGRIWSLQNITYRYCTGAECFYPPQSNKCTLVALADGTSIVVFVGISVLKFLVSYSRVGLICWYFCWRFEVLSFIFARRFNLLLTFWTMSKWRRSASNKTLCSVCFNASLDMEQGN